MNHNKHVIMSNIMLIVASAIWGANFLFQKIAASQIGPITFMGVRCCLGSITLFLLTLWMNRNYGRDKKTAKKADRDKPVYDSTYFKKLFIFAPLCGIVNVTGSTLVQIGLLYTSVSKAGFLSSIYIIFVPFFGFLFFGKKTGRYIYAGVLLALIGLYSLCLSESLSIGKGDLIILSSTLFFALHIHLIARFVHEVDGVQFSCVEFSFASIVCMILAFIFEHPTMAQLSGCSISLLYSGILGAGVCYALQVTAQKYTDPTVATLLMSLESVFSAFCGFLFLQEHFTARELVGASLIFASIIMAQLPAKKR